MQALLALLSAVLSAMLRTWLDQRGHIMAIEQRVRLEGALHGYEAAARALAYKTRAGDDRDVSVDLGVRDAGTHIVVPGDTPTVEQPAGDPSLRRDGTERGNPAP